MRDLVNHLDPFCPELDKQPCWNAWFYFYWVPEHQENYTRLMKTPEGQLWMIRNLPERFGLRDVELEWLMKDASPNLAQR